MCLPQRTKDQERESGRIETISPSPTRPSSFRQFIHHHRNRRPLLQRFCHRLGRRIDLVQEQVREEPDDEEKDDDRDQDQHLAPAQIFDGRVLRLGQRPLEHLADGPQQIPGRQDDAERAEDGERLLRLECAEQDVELADEAVQPRQPGRRQRHDDEQDAEDRNLLPQPAEIGQQAGVPPVVEHADQQEQGARAQPVVHHLEGRAGDPLRVQREDAEHDEAQVRHRRIGDERLEILLHQRDHRAVQDADERQRRDPRHEGVGRGREERQAEAHEAVGAHLQEHRGQDHRAAGGRRHVRIGQPGVEREERHLDGEGQGERREEPDLQVRRQLHPLQLQQVEGVRLRLEIEHQDGDEHQRAAEHGVDEELDRRVDPPLHDPAAEVVGAVRIAPAADQEIHRDQRQLPEDEEEYQVERHEDADHPRFEQQHQGQVRAQPLADPFPGEDQHEHRDQRGEQHQEQAQAIDAHQVFDVELRHPGRAFDELHARLAVAPADPQQARHGERGEADQQRPPLLEPLPRQDQQHQRADQREEDDGREYREIRHYVLAQDMHDEDEGRKTNDESALIPPSLVFGLWSLVSHHRITNHASSATAPSRIDSA